MNAIFVDVEKYLKDNKPDNFVISEKEIKFFAGSFDFIIKPRYDNISEEIFFEIEIEVI